MLACCGVLMKLMMCFMGLIIFQKCLFLCFYIAHIPAHARSTTSHIANSSLTYSITLCSFIFLLFLLLLLFAEWQVSRQSFLCFFLAAFSFTLFSFCLSISREAVTIICICLAKCLAAAAYHTTYNCFMCNVI